MIVATPAVIVATTLLSAPDFGVVGKVECPEPPPNTKAKAVCDKVVTVKENKADRRSESPIPRLLVPVTTSAFVTDDEDEEFSN